MSDDNDIDLSPIYVRFGSILLQEGFTAIPNLLLQYYRDMKMNNNELVFTIEVWSFWWSADHPFPSVPLIAERMKCGRSSIQRYSKSLVDKKLLQIEERFDTNGQTSNEYDFSPMLEKLLKTAMAKGFTPKSRGGPKSGAGSKNRSGAGPAPKVGHEEYTKKKVRSTDKNKDTSADEATRYTKSLQELYGPDGRPSLDFTQD